MSIASSCRAAALALALAAIGALFPASAADIPVTHAKGTTVLPGVPQRVAVYDLAALDILDALGVDVAAVPGARFPAHLTRYGDDRYAKVGTLFIPDVEALTAARPDLIIVGGRSASRYDELTAIAPTLDLGADSDDFSNSIVATTLTLGRVFDRNAEAAALVGKYLETRAGLAARLGDADGLVLFSVGGGLNPNAPGERFGIFHDLLLMPSVLPTHTATDEGPRPEAGSPEAQARREAGAKRLADALNADPDWIFVLDRPSATGGESEAEASLAAQPLVAASSAGRHGRVVVVDAPTWYLAPGGIQSAQQLLEQVGEIATRGR